MTLIGWFEACYLIRYLVLTSYQKVASKAAVYYDDDSTPGLQLNPDQIRVLRVDDEAPHARGWRGAA